MIDKTLNCTAEGSRESAGPVYGDYTDVMESIVFREGAVFRGVEIFE